LREVVVLRAGCSVHFLFSYARAVRNKPGVANRLDVTHKTDAVGAYFVDVAAALFWVALRVVIASDCHPVTFARVRASRELVAAIAAKMAMMAMTMSKTFLKTVPS
jgi:hypothetical protein